MQRISMANDSIILEVCVDSLESALAAERGGAHRIELCSELIVGGITPSQGLIAAVRELVKLKLHVMIRPRGGDFCYSVHDYDVMIRDVDSAKTLGADGIVLGILTKEGRVDRTRTRELVERARPLSVTFHRAFDMARDLDEALSDVRATGADRVLTSGGEQSAEDGMNAIANLVAEAGESLIIVAASGLTESNARRIVQQTAVREIHASLSETIASPVGVQRKGISLSVLWDYERKRVSEERVRQALAAVNATQP